MSLPLTVDYEEDVEMTVRAAWLAWPLHFKHTLPCKVSHFHLLDNGRKLRGPFITKWCASLWRGSATYSLFFVTRPVTGLRSVSGVCAGGVWANVKWTIKKRSEEVIFPCLVLFSQNVSLVIPLHISSDLSYVSVYHSQRPSFGDTSSVAYAALHTDGSFC